MFAPFSSQEFPFHSKTHFRHILNENISLPDFSAQDPVSRISDSKNISSKKCKKKTSPVLIKEYLNTDLSYNRTQRRVKANLPSKLNLNQQDIFCNNHGQE